MFYENVRLLDDCWSFFFDFEWIAEAFFMIFDEFWSFEWFLMKFEDYLINPARPRLKTKTEKWNKRMKNTKLWTKIQNIEQNNKLWHELLYE